MTATLIDSKGNAMALDAKRTTPFKRSCRRWALLPNPKFLLTSGLPRVRRQK